jgi:hypothetical protein
VRIAESITAEEREDGVGPLGGADAELEGGCGGEESPHEIK